MNYVQWGMLLADVALRSSIEILADHPQAESFPRAAFDVMELGHLPAEQSDIYVACCFKVAELGPVTGEGERVRRHVRVRGMEEDATESPLASAVGP